MKIYIRRRMERRTKFTAEEIEDLKVFVRSYSRATTGAERKKFRGKMRAVGFYVSEFGIENIDIGKFQSLLKSGRIGIIKDSPTLAASKSPVTILKGQEDNSISISELEKRLCHGEFISAKDLDKSTGLNCFGFYCIRLRDGSQLPEKYQNDFRSRNHRIIYIGKAEGQTLKKRFLGQELRAEGHGTFFRSIGAVLGYVPETGSLNRYKNKKNYRFSPKDEVQIITWINNNLEVNWVSFNGDFSVEKELISKYCPLLNHTYNPKKLQELIIDKANCRSIANEKK